MRITVTDYLDVVSSWCFWSEPTWAELKKRYQDRVEFQWKIALMDPSGLPPYGAQSSAVEKRIRAATAEFHSFQVTQRPAFLIDTEIGDRAIFSGVVELEPLAATVHSMLDDATAYAAHKAHFGDPPPK